VPLFNNESLEYLKIGFAFGGALLGSVIGTPMVEWFKDLLGARRTWKNQRREILSTIRLILGILRAFYEIRASAFGPKAEEPSYSERGFARLRKFDFSLFNQSMVKLSSIHPDDSAHSAIGQRLIQHLIVVQSHFEQMQSIKAISIRKTNENPSGFDLRDVDKIILVEAETKYLELNYFLRGLYAQRLGIKPKSLMIDDEIRDFENKIAKHVASQSTKKMH
jgi:hypothetical protein